MYFSHLFATITVIGITGTHMAKAENTTGFVIDPYPPPFSDDALKILPLGDSITWGYRSSDVNGYRKTLFDALTGNRIRVQMAGSIRVGTMIDNRNEGHIGATITEIATFAKPSLLLKPDVILLMAGTNDMFGLLNLPDAPRRLGNLIDQCHDACPNATILVARIPPSGYWVTQSCIAAFNPTIPGLVETRAKKGMKVLSVDMEDFMTTDDLDADAVHPNDLGYQKIATAWISGLNDAVAKGWVTLPFIPASTNCEIPKPSWLTNSSTNSIINSSISSPTSSATSSATSLSTDSPISSAASFPTMPSISAASLDLPLKWLIILFVVATMVLVTIVILLTNFVHDDKPLWFRRSKLSDSKATKFQHLVSTRGGSIDTGAGHA